MGLRHCHEVLRTNGFNGFVIGDWNGHAEIRDVPYKLPRILLAGVDMYMAPDSWKGLYESLLKQVKDGTVPMERLDEAVLRILTVKVRSGLSKLVCRLSDRVWIDRSSETRGIVRRLGKRFANL